MRARRDGSHTALDAVNEENEKAVNGAGEQSREPGARGERDPKEANRARAAASRKRKRERLEEHENRVKELEEENASLRKQVEQMRSENRGLQSAISIMASNLAQAQAPPAQQQPQPQPPPDQGLGYSILPEMMPNGFVDES